MKHEEVSRSLRESPRFRPPPSRRDMLGLAAIWSAVLACGGALLGAVRLPMPAVFPESESKVKIGPPDAFPKDSATQLTDLQLLVRHDGDGLYAISTVCTHLGCVAARDADGGFHCPCHGSVFAPDGRVLGGPAPRGLDWLELTVAPDGQLVVDTTRRIPTGTHLRLEA